MGKNLVIVESPAKAKTIGKFLGKDFVVKSSIGHVRDLPERRFGVNVKKGFEPQYVVVKGKKKVIDDLVREAEKCDAVYLAPDPDREGEAIAWHLKALLGDKAGKDIKFYRVSYNQVTAPAVRAAFEQPSEIDMNRVHAQQARRIVDRIVGYKVSPLLWSRVKRGSSAGRVQSVALRLVCEREHKIRDFVPEAYWIIGAKVRKLMAPMDAFVMKLVKINGEKADVKSEDRAAQVAKDLKDRRLKVLNIQEKEVSRKAPPPFITSTLQQAASTFLNMSPSATMRVAQQLYEGVDTGGETAGLITYMRTDSVSIAPEALSSCRDYIVDKYGKKYLPESANVFKSGKGAQEAHEAIRPADVGRTPESLGGKLEPRALKLYKLIWGRFVASQMVPAKIHRMTVEAEAVSEGEVKHAYLFRASASKLAFDGFMKASGVPKDRKEKAEDGDEVEGLPPLSEGEALMCLEWLSDRKETKPPDRYSEAALIRALQQNGLGRPSTYAQIVSTLSNRGYAKRQKRTLTPTDLGMKVNAFLMSKLAELFDVQFTARMEEMLDKVEEGDVEWDAMVGGFYTDFSKWIDVAKGPPADPEKVGRILELLQGVTEWAPEVQYGKRKYSDERFTASIKKQLDEGEKPISDRQLAALVKVACRYESQVPTIADALTEMEFDEIAKVAREENKGPGEATLKKLSLLEKVECDEPVKRGSRTYDDRKFLGSLGARAASGRSLTEAQRAQLDRLLFKYSDQVPDFEAVKKELGLVAGQKGEDAESGILLKMLERVKEWNPPRRRGNREFDDKKFYNSLRQQYDRKGALSARQQAALKKMVGRYSAQTGPLPVAKDKQGQEGANGANGAAKGPEESREAAE